MEKFSLVEALTKEGTLNDPEGIPSPEFARNAAVNWVSSLRQLSELRGSDSDYLGSISKLKAGNWDSRIENTAFSMFFSAVRRVASIREMESVTNTTACAADAVVLWYYALYDSARASLVLMSGGAKSNHAANADAWFREIAQRGLVPYPWRYGLTSLVKSDASTQLASLGHERANYINSEKLPMNLEWSKQVHLAYLSGSADWYRATAELQLKKEMGIDSFRSKDNKTLRDQRLKKKSIGLLHLASRYRGKANYRESIYLSSNQMGYTRAKVFISDLAKSAERFVADTAPIIERRVGQTKWREFLDSAKITAGFEFDF